MHFDISVIDSVGWAAGSAELGARPPLRLAVAAASVVSLLTN
jgi:hypothetical protein